MTETAKRDALAAHTAPDRTAGRIDAVDVTTASLSEDWSSVIDVSWLFIGSPWPSLVMIVFLNY